MNLDDATGALRMAVFRALRKLSGLLPGGRISAFGAGQGKISKIFVVNLDRQPQRWRRMRRELNRFSTHDGASLTSILHRMPAVDARDGRAVAATADVDVWYRIGHQLHVQPDAKLEACFGVDEPIRMTRQEVAVARSHVEVWKSIARGPDKFVLVLEDDVWFRPGAGQAIDRAWRAALSHSSSDVGPRLVYFSYSDADGTAERIALCDDVFRPVRGLWFLSGYVLSREGARILLEAMPVIGPVDMWMNYRFEDLDALAISSPAILQRRDAGSDNSYSILPYLARAGTIDASSASLPSLRGGVAPLLAWTGKSEYEGLSMALSMLGLRVRVFDGNEPPIQPGELRSHFESFDALIDATIAPAAVSDAIALGAKFIVEGDDPPLADRLPRLSLLQTEVLRGEGADDDRWKPICALLGLPEPAQAFPLGAERARRVFRDDRGARLSVANRTQAYDARFDESPWVLNRRANWRPAMVDKRETAQSFGSVGKAPTAAESPGFRTLTETFPGNLAWFSRDRLSHLEGGVSITAVRDDGGTKPYRSGAFATAQRFDSGRFEAEIKAAAGPGLVTGFFLHRDAPRQEIDIEIVGADPTRMLVNVYFNPGDEGATLSYGYRGTPYQIDLGFDATADFHNYAIDWRPDRITWLVDGRVVHARVGWDPTPLPHLPMNLHGNLWIPRSEELAGRIDDSALPATAIFRNISVRH